MSYEHDEMFPPEIIDPIAQHALEEYFPQPSQHEGVLKTAWAEAKNAPLADKALLAFSTFGYGFEVGPGNEWAVAKVGKTIMEQTAHHGDVRLSSIAVGGGLAALSLAEHTILGLAMLRNIKRFPKTVDTMASSKFANSGALRNSRERGLLARFGNAFTVGASTVNLEDSITDPEFITEKKGIKRTLGSAALIASGSALIGSSAGAGIQHAINEGNQELAETMLDLASNPLPWLGLFAVTRGIDYIKNKRKKPETLPIQ